MPQNTGQSPPPLPVAAVPVGVALDYASAPSIARGIAWQRSAGRLHVGFDSSKPWYTGSFESSKPTSTEPVAAAGGVMLLGLVLLSILVCAGMQNSSAYDEQIGLSALIGLIGLGTPAVGYFVYRVMQRRRLMAAPVELDATLDGLSLLIPAKSSMPLVWPAGQLREIRCNAVPGCFCVEVFPADSPPEEHWFDIAGELAPEVLEIELRQILRLGEAAAPANPTAPLSYATPIQPSQPQAFIPWIRRTDYLLVLLPPPVPVPLHGCIMSLGALGGIIAFIYILMALMNLDKPAIPVVCLFVGTTLLGLLAAILIGRRSRTTPSQRDRATLVMACPGKLWLHVRSERSAPESFDAARIKSLTINAHPRGLWLHIQADDGAVINRFLPTIALAAGAALCDDLQRILKVRPVRGL